MAMGSGPVYAFILKTNVPPVLANEVLSERTTAYASYTRMLVESDESYRTLTERSFGGL